MTTRRALLFMAAPPAIVRVASLMQLPAPKRLYKSPCTATNFMATYEPSFDYDALVTEIAAAWNLPERYIRFPEPCSELTMYYQRIGQLYDMPAEPA